MSHLIFLHRWWRINKLVDILSWTSFYKCESVYVVDKLAIKCQLSLGFSQVITSLINCTTSLSVSRPCVGASTYEYEANLFADIQPYKTRQKFYLQRCYITAQKCSYKLNNLVVKMSVTREWIIFQFIISVLFVVNKLT